MISYDCLIFDNNSHSLNYTDRREEIDHGFPNGTMQKETDKIDTKPLVIQNDVWIGTKAMIMKGVTIEARSVIAAGTVITKDVPHDVLVYDNPNKYRKLN